MAAHSLGSVKHAALTEGILVACSCNNGTVSGWAKCTWNGNPKCWDAQHTYKRCCDPSKGRYTTTP
jgi:hypothetical protein